MTFTVEFEREYDGRWLAEVLELPGVLAYGQTSDEQSRKRRLWPCAPWQIGSNTPKALPNFSTSTSPQHEPMVFSQSKTRSRRTAPHRMEHQTRIQFSLNSFPSRLA